MLGHHRFASKFNGVSLVARCRQANSVPCQKSKSWTPLPKHHAPTQVLRLNTPPPPPPPQSFLATPMWFSSWCKRSRLNSSSIGFVVVGFGSYYHLIIFLTTNTSLNFYKKAWSTLNNSFFRPWLGV